MEATNRPKWLSRSLRWKPRFGALAIMRLDELTTIDDKFHYCDAQSHLKLGSGRTVYFGLMALDGKEVAIRKLKTKQLSQLQPQLIRSLLALRHPNLLRTDQFCILKVGFNYYFELTTQLFRTKPTSSKSLLTLAWGGGCAIRPW